MKRQTERSGVTRRRALAGMAAGALSAAGAVRRVAGGEAPSVGVCVGREPNGVELWQVTTEEYSQSNIYCEVPYCDAKSRFFVYQRHNPRVGHETTELMVVELGSWRQHRLDTASSISGLAVTPTGALYYFKRGEGNSRKLMRADIAEGNPRQVYLQPDGSRNRSLGTVSRDERYYVTGTRPSEAWDRFGILLIDLEKGEESLLDEDPYILNAHPQFDPAADQLLIQHNRGGLYSPDGKRIRLVGPEGATLYCLSVPEGRRTPLAVGKPHTTPCTGHEAWIGQTHEVLLSVGASGQYSPEKGNLLAAKPNGPVRRVAKGYRFNHVGVSRCGRVFSADDWQGTYQIVIGSTTTGHTAVVCHSQTRPDGSQNTHPHAYLTPDLKWVIFNSNRSGFPHVYAARLPDQMIGHLTG